MVSLSRYNSKSFGTGDFTPAQPVMSCILFAVDGSKNGLLPDALQMRELTTHSKKKPMPYVPDYIPQIFCHYGNREQNAAVKSLGMQIVQESRCVLDKGHQQWSWNVAPTITGTDVNDNAKLFHGVVRY
jgi:hypothetical protein